MVTSRAFCTIKYSLTIDGAAPSYFTFTNTTRTLTMSSSNNCLGNLAIPSVLTGVNFGGVT